MKISSNQSVVEMYVLWGFSSLLRFCCGGVVIVGVIVFSELLALSSWVASVKCFK